MNKPRISILLTTGMKKMVLARAEDARLKKLGQVRFKDYQVIDYNAVKDLIRGADAIITGWSTPALTEEILDCSPDLQIIAHSAGSVKYLIPDVAWKRRIVVTSAAASIGIGVAEYALGLLITGMKRVSPFTTITRGGDWRPDGELRKVREFYRTSIGVVGAGFVGRHMIKLLQNFSVSIFLYDPFVSKEEARKLGVEKVSLDNLMRRSDAVTLHAPSLPSTRHMINAANLSLLKENAVLVNTARGALIDEKALVTVLKKRKDLSALLDVTDPEPPAVNSHLRKLPNVVLTPHIAGAVSNNIYRQGDFVVTELERFFAGKKPVYPVTKEMLTRIA